MATLNLDRYARDARAWQDWAAINHAASQLLFANGNPSLYFPAVTLGHHTLEMYLKAVLIGEGMTVFDPKQVKKLDPEVGLTADRCAWGHNLVALAQLLAAKRRDFNLSAEIYVPSLVLKMPMELLAAFELFDPFFSELRYPMELQKIAGFGDEEGLVLDALVDRLLPFLKNVP